ncbi:hypothetical protein N7448_000420 [Penicillium atrosanguineum]|uniref:ASST-domain-containing protein n=1 Tax=Penicillium atrosanguineum TaxID=1132637 RepID=A0A9W9LCM8_9EURO|nr:uncharacterized protein N7443_003817 [Penicillium atrosanguineum]KAJ5148842.1 hypothetical protein N7448_000420 [Penicillium atrosanguineum]KAJ5304157.1 hypothetical protein N7443_003817 [Penicillium atrosanguineum]KAJ5323633.1 hypothetical protein N7476_002233 [Penicillium atrosanguineum]
MIILAWVLAWLSASAIAHSLDDEFMSFVTLPEVYAPRFEIQYHDRNRVGPGYWFVAPYGKMIPKNPITGRRPFHVGPHIYDQNGTLIWTGSQMVENLRTYDFKTIRETDGQIRLSFIVARNRTAIRGRAIVLNQNYEVEFETSGPDGVEEFDFHEFNVLSGGKSALACVHWTKEMSLADFGRSDEKSSFISAGFYEVDMFTGDILTQWDSSAPGNIAIHESVQLGNDSSPQEAPGYDYLHINSVDKQADGHYLVSMRFTNTIYLISGIDGKILWRLGGSETDFDQDFVFSKQHDARFLESNGTHHVISFLNNASDDEKNEEPLSSALIVGLETNVSPKRARVISRYNRPDNQLTRLRGNIQQLPNGNVFVGWSDHGYHSEFSSDGEVLMEARFLMNYEFATYRAYKSEFIGRPNTPPALIASVTESLEQGFLTTIYASWNGATDIASWDFYAQGGEDYERFLLGTSEKTGFETKFEVKGHFGWISAEAIDHKGHVLGRSKVHHIATPSHWEGTEVSETATPESLKKSLAFPVLLPVFVASIAILVVVFWFATNRLRPFKHSYQRVPAEVEDTELQEFR